MTPDQMLHVTGHSAPLMAQPATQESSITAEGAANHCRNSRHSALTSVDNGVAPKPHSTASDLSKSSNRTFLIGPFKNWRSLFCGDTKGSESMIESIAPGPHEEILVLKRDIRSLNLNAQSLGRELQDLSLKNEFLQHELRDGDEAIRSCKKQLQERNVQIQTLHHVVEELESHREALERKYKQALDEKRKASRDSKVEMSATTEARDKKIRALEVDNKELVVERDLARENLENLVRNQQENSFGSVESACWTPQEDSKVRGSLEELKLSMKSASKKFTMTMVPPFGLLDQHQHDLFLEHLLRVIRWDENGKLPGLNEEKTSGLAFNALLAHDICVKIFKSPFFVFEDLKTGGNKIMELYKMILNSKCLPFPVAHPLKLTDVSLPADEKDSNAWRAQTLRLLRPQKTDTEIELKRRRQMDEMITRVADSHALTFLNGPANVFLKTDTRPEASEKIRSLYNDAAFLSYNLWTRKTFLKCTTFQEMPQDASFDITDPKMVPHTLVRYDEHDDRLKGRPIRLLVHPLLEAYGNDEGEQYHKGRTWAPAEVWLQSRAIDK